MENLSLQWNCVAQRIRADPAETRRSRAALISATSSAMSYAPFADHPESMEWNSYPSVAWKRE